MSFLSTLVLGVCLSLSAWGEEASAPAEATAVEVSAVTDTVTSETIVTPDEEAHEILAKEVAQIKLEATAAPVPVVTEPIKATAAQKESEIPVLQKIAEKKTIESSSTGRLVGGFVVIMILAGGLIVFSRWYAKRSLKSTNNNKIRILTQHFLGPRKSLAMVRVAGETILIGITDQNISMLKTLSLIDDEFSENLPKSFDKSMLDADASAAAKTVTKDEDEFVLSNIQDKITTRLKGLRQI